MVDIAQVLVPIIVTVVVVARAVVLVVGSSDSSSNSRHMRGSNSSFIRAGVLGVVLVI